MLRLPKIAVPRLTPFSIALTYTLIGAIWLFFSDQLLLEFLPDPAALVRVKILNEWIFIVVSTQLLYLLMRRREIDIERSQASLHKVNRALKVFSECNKVVAWEKDEATMLRRICQLFVEVGGYRLAWVAFARRDADKRVDAVAHFGDTYGYLHQLHVTWDESVYGQGPAGTAIRTGRTTVVQDIDSDAGFLPWRARAQRHGYAAAIALPLSNDLEVFGALVILAGESAAFSGEEIGLLEELSSDLAFGISSLHLRDEKAAINQERRLIATAIEQTSEGVLIFDAAGVVSYANGAYESICGLPPGSTVGASIHQLSSCVGNADFYWSLQATIASGSISRGHFVNRRPDGSRYEISTNISPVRQESDQETRFVAVVHDCTHETELEKQLRTAQKMEAIATLAGGIAHDFNNILASIVTNAELSLDDLPPQGSLRESLEIILKAGQRGRSLVRQIMTLSRQGDQERQPVQVDRVAAECLALLRASLPATIELRRTFAAALPPVPADPSQIHQVIMNLCTNAADAMAESGGTLEIMLEAGQPWPQASPDGAAPTERYLKLTVRDSGMGMERRVMERIYDPFFTTKKHGKGTGLGLSVVHGIVRNHAGLLRVESEPGKGTTFEVYLPQTFAAERPPAPLASPDLRGGHERILLVDDEADLVTAGRKMLERLGYDVVAGTDSREALRRFAAEPERFDLLITDQTMPHLTGEMLAREVLRIRNDLPIILCSGMGATFAGGLSPERAHAIGIRELLAKPYERQEMCAAIRRLLD